MTAEDFAKARKDLLLDIQNEYIAFLGEEYDKLASFATTHGWVCPRETVAKGQKLRDELAKLRDDLPGSTTARKDKRYHERLR